MSDLGSGLIAALAAGLFGSAHCLGMCAGISGLFALHASVAGLARQLPMALAYNFGRLLSYAALGLLIAIPGSGIATYAPGLAAPIRLAAAAVMILIGLQIAFDIRLLAWLERMGGAIWNRFAPIAKRLLPVTTVPRAIALGLLWGLLPCGLVYSALLLAATRDDAVDGALLMFVFGLGTTPAMLLTGLGAARLAHWMRRRSARLGAGLLIVALGILTATMPLATRMMSGGHGEHQVQERS